MTSSEWENIFLFPINSCTSARPPSPVPADSLHRPVDTPFDTHTHTHARTLWHTWTQRHTHIPSSGVQCSRPHSAQWKTADSSAQLWKFQQFSSCLGDVLVATVYPWLACLYINICQMLSFIISSFSIKSLEAVELSIIMSERNCCCVYFLEKNLVEFCFCLLVSFWCEQ